VFRKIFHNFSNKFLPFIVPLKNNIKDILAQTNLKRFLVVQNLKIDESCVFIVSVEKLRENEHATFSDLQLNN